MKTATVSTRDDAVDTSDGVYVVPIVHMRLPERLVQLGYWGALGATVVVGAVDLPVAAAVVGGVMIARHVRR